MKRIFTLTILMTAFVMNVAAWEPVIKEKHWFGIYEYYRYTDPAFNANNCLSNLDFSSLDGWTTSDNSGYSVKVSGNIGTCSYTLGSSNENNLRTFTSTTDTYHKATEYCFGIEARWAGNQAQISQQTSANLTEGTYRLTYDVQNVNSETLSKSYDNLFYVQIDGGAKVTDNSTEWMGVGSSGWTTHTIEFSILSTEQGGTGPAKVTISMGYGLPSDLAIGHTQTPALFVSQMKLIKITGAPIDSKTITWSSQINTNNGPFLESIEIKKGWTGQNPLQAPKTTYYSWIERQLRFSVNRSECWDIDNNGSGSYEGVGLYNKSDDATCFWIHNLKANDQFNIEYYREPRTSPAPFLVSGSVNGLTPADSYSGSNAIYGTSYYTMSNDGDVSINIPSHTLIRSVTIIHANYQKATATVTPYGNTPGYTYRLTGPGVLEDKRGAVPYITMRFGAENDMAFVRNLGSPGDGNTYYGASCIVDESNNFDPDGAKLQAPYHVFTAAQMKDRLAGKEWSVFTASQTQSSGTNDYRMNNGHNGSAGDYFNTIYPLYGSYYYFFPEVHGRLIMEFYCEGSDETPAFWYKRRGDGTFPQVGDQPTVTKTSASGDLNGNDKARTNGSNFYRFTVDVEKDGVYYLCSLPTNIAHEHPTLRLISYTFIPEFRVEPLYKVVENATQTASNAATIYGGTATVGEISSDSTDSRYYTMKENGQDIPLVKCVGNIKSAVAEITNGGNDTQYLTIKNITFKDGENVNQGGAVVVHINCDAGEAAFVLTVAYDAANKNPDGTAVSTQIKKWDFYDGGEGTGGILDIGKYNGYTAKYPDANWFNASQLYKEVNKADGLTADWVDTYVNIMETVDAKKERIFKSVYDMAGDNADMLHETAGLVFFTDANQMGILNENSLPTSEFQDRYIGLMKGAKFNIPLLEAGDRIVMKMGTYGNLSSAPETTTLHITNANDAVGTAISANADYEIGGSGPVAGDVKDADNHYVPRGEYHFSAAADGDVTFEMTNGQLLKLYSIEIYRNAKNNNAGIITENEFVGDKPEILYTDKDNNQTQKFKVKLNYTGIGETQTMTGLDAGNYRTGKFKAQGATVPTFNQTGDGQFESTTAIAHDMFGSFRSRIGVQTRNNTYITDYADGDLAVGYRETKTYPYTWDFTDLKKYVGVGIGTDGNENNVSKITVNNEEVTLDELKIWDQFGLRVNSEAATGTLFVSGGQLYGDQTMFEETKGIGIGYTKSDAAHNKKLSITGTASDESGGLAISGDDVWTFTVPQVAAEQAVYVHATPKDGAEWPQYAIGNGTKQNLSFLGNNAFAMKMADNATTADVTLYFQGCEVNKIAVATDAKTVNKFGWNTESREHPIDPSLLPYMTGKDFRTYIVTEANEENNTVTLARIDGGSANGDNANMKLIVPGATKVENEATVPDNGSINACIIRYVDDTVAEDAKEVNLFGNGSGFHLFVPDIHDAVSTIPPTNLLKARVTATTDNDKVARDETVESKTFNNYAFTYKYRKVNDNGDPYTDQKEGVQAFYRIVSGGARSGGHQAYLSIEAPAASRASSRAAASSQSAEHYDILFQEWDNIEQMKGDVNGDGRFNKLDVNTMADYVAGRPAGIFKGLADMNDDGNIDIVDMTLMIKKITGE